MNNGDINTRHDGEEPQAPPKLVAALKEPPARRVFVPPSVDAAILAAARKQLAGRGGRAGLWSGIRAWLVWPAMATACLALIGLIYVLMKSGADREEFAREDLNHDGRVDILDAFELAREAGAGVKPDAGRDLNGDGVVDSRDAAVIAAHAVKLEKGRRS